MKKIAIIEDDQHIGDVLERTLTREGYEILRAYSGTEALYLLSEHTPDLNAVIVGNGVFNGFVNGGL